MNYILNNLLIIGIALVILLFIITLIVIFSIRKKKYRVYLTKCSEYDIEKTRIVNLPVSSELAKLDLVIKNKDLLVQLNDWNDRWNVIKAKELKQTTNAIIDFETQVEKRKFRNIESYEMACRGTIQDLRNATNALLEEVLVLSKCEEDNRKLITELKQNFRNTKKSFLANEPLLLFVKEEIENEFQKLNNLIIDLEQVISVNEYEQSRNIVESVDQKLKKVELIVEKLPDILLIAKQLIPRKIDFLERIYEEALANNVYLKHMEFDVKIREAKNLVAASLDNIKNLNLVDIDLNLESVSKYLENLEELLVSEIKMRNLVIEEVEAIILKIDRTKAMVDDLEKEFVKVKTLYDMSEVEEVDTEEFLEICEGIEKDLVPYRELCPQIDESYEMYRLETSKLYERLESLFVEVTTNLDSILKMRADEQRAHEQILEIKALVDESNSLIRNAKLPVVPGMFTVYVEDASEAIEYIVEELNNVPIDINSLNVRVDTALELAFKLFESTRVFVKEAVMVEAGILYGNRFRSSLDYVDIGLRKSEELFYKGKYNESLTNTINILEKAQPGFYKWLMLHFDNDGDKV